MKRRLQRIQLQIFLPVLLVIMILPLISLLSFSVISRAYFRQEAAESVLLLEKELREKAAAYLEDAAADTENTNPPAESNPLLSETERQRSRELMQQLRSVARNQDTGADLLSISSRYGLSYPDKEEAAASILTLYERCAFLLHNDRLPEHQTQYLRSGQDVYAVRLIQTGAQQRLLAKYVVCYVKVPVSSALIGNIGRLLFLITLLCLLAAMAFVWRIAKRISDPISCLCTHALSIESGSWQQIPDVFSICELEELRTAFNTMCEKLEVSEANTMRFFQNISHDLRTPLVSIGGYAQGIETGQFEDPAKAAKIILSESRRMSELVEKILMISRMDNHALPLQIIRLPLAAFLQEQTEILGQAANAEGKEIRIQTPPGQEKEFYIEADAALLTRIVQNILSNCLRYAEKNVEILLSRKQTQVLIQIQDDGPGLSEEALLHAFERFYVNEGGKCGLGLSIAGSGIRYLGGDITLQNRKAPEHGACYLISLPLSSN